MRAEIMVSVICLVWLGLSNDALADENTSARVERPVFAEDSGHDDGWEMTTHGYVRMPLRLHGNPVDARPPYLVDDDYYLSGFAYTRVNETEWAELFLSTEHHNSRVVIGLLASQFSDWSETSLQGQRGIALAFVEQSGGLGDIASFDVRAGMFWERQGYVPAYDTYVVGRAHVGGVRAGVRLWDSLYLRLGYGAHADVITSNQGFTPMAWAAAGVDLGWVDLVGYQVSTWTRDTEREFSIVEQGELDSVGLEMRLAIPWVGSLHLVAAQHEATRAMFLANSFEVVHSTGGRGLTQNFFGPESDSGTGTIGVGAWDLTWRPALIAERLWGESAAARILENSSLRCFGMIADVDSAQKSDDPAVNRDNRRYVKWGTEVMVRPHWHDWQWLFAAIRYDRVILDTQHESLAFRVLTPRLGVTPREGFDVFAAWSVYDYGSHVRLRPNQIQGDVSVTQPDHYALKLQAQVSW